MENAMFERLELQNDDILQAYYMRSQSLLLLEYAGTLEETLGFSDSTDKPQAVLAQMAAAESPTNGEKRSRQNIFWHLRKKTEKCGCIFTAGRMPFAQSICLTVLLRKWDLLKGMLFPRVDAFRQLFSRHI